MSASDYVVLKNGLALPLAAVQFALDCENRGLSFAIEDGDVLVVGPRERLTDDDRTLIRKFKPHLCAIVTYTADAGLQ